MLSKHPGSQLLKTPGDPPVDIRFGTDQHIQVTAVTPEPNRTLPIFTCPDVPPAVRSYYEHRQVVYARMGILVLSVGDSSVNAFSSTRPITKPDREGNEEVWLEKTCYTTEQAFPTVLRRSDITEWEVVEISPVDHAYNEVEQKTRELDSLHLRYSALAKTTQVFSTNALSMTLNSVVDPPAESIPGYREAFFNLAYVTRHSDREEQVERLRTAIDDHVSCVPFFSRMRHERTNRCRCASSTAVSNCTGTSARQRCSVSTRPWKSSFGNTLPRKSAVSRRRAGSKTSRRMCTHGSPIHRRSMRTRRCSGRCRRAGSRACLGCR